jgi:hypothetical protein
MYGLTRPEKREFSLSGEFSRETTTQLEREPFSVLKDGVLFGLGVRCRRKIRISAPVGLQSASSKSLRVLRHKHPNLAASQIPLFTLLLRQGANSRVLPHIRAITAELAEHGVFAMSLLAMSEDEDQFVPAEIEGTLSPLFLTQTHRLSSVSLTLLPAASISPIDASPS